MTPTLWLRAAALFTLVYCIGHTIGAPWTPATNPQQLAVIDAMKSSPFQVFGSTRTYWDFYFGFGVAIGGYLAVQAVVLWQLSSLARRDAVQIRPIASALLAAFVFNAIVVWQFFFAPPLALAIAVVVCLGLAIVSIKTESSQVGP